jgi:uncharacterized membrane protein
MTHEDLARFHSDPANWKLGIFYFCPGDRRIIVPKRIKGLGWTVNLARPMAVPFFLSLIGLIWGVLALARRMGVAGESYLVIKLILAAGIIALLYHLGHRSSRISGEKPESEERDS